MKYEYETLKKQYKEFACPVMRFCVDGKWLDECSETLIINDVTVRLTCGYEAGDATLMIYGCTDETTGEFLFEELKTFIALGSPAILELGYADKTEEVFCGYIARTECICEEFPAVEVTLTDMKGILMAGTEERQLKAASYAEAVRELLNGEAYGELKQTDLLRQIRIDATPDKQENKETGVRTIELVSESVYDFIVRAAKKFGYEFFADCGVLNFRKAKPDDTVLMELNAGQAVLSARVSYDIRGIVRETEVRSMDTSKGEAVTAVKKQVNKLSYGNKVNLAAGGRKQICIDASVRSGEEAEARAESLLEENAYEFGRLECECIGLPVLKPGYFVRLKGYGPPADNRFYVTEVEHSLSEYGYVTRITAKAAAMEEV